MTSFSTIGERLRAIRKRAGLAQDAFGTALGYSRRAVINWERDAAEPPIGILPKLRRLFDVDPEWVVMGEDATPRNQYGPVDWARFDCIRRDVDAACTQVGVDLEPGVRDELIRNLFDAPPDEDKVRSKQLRETLRLIGQGKL